MIIFSTKYCIDAGGGNGACMIYQCHDSTTAWQQFFHLNKDAHVVHHTIETCLNIPSTKIKFNDEWNYNPVSFTKVIVNL